MTMSRKTRIGIKRKIHPKNSIIPGGDGLSIRVPMRPTDHIGPV